MEEPKAYDNSEELAKVGRHLINTKFQHLGAVRVDFVFVNKIAKSAKREVWGKCRLISGLSAFLAGSHDQGEPVSFFLVEIPSEIWYRLNEKGREALCHHELSHAWVDEEGVRSLVSHELECFLSEVRDYGYWRDDLKAMEKTVREQSTLFDTAPLSTKEVLEQAIEKTAPGHKVSVNGGDVAIARAIANHPSMLTKD